VFVTTNMPAPGESGVAALVLLLRFHGIAADSEQMRHHFGIEIGVYEMLRCAKAFGLKAPFELAAADQNTRSRHRGAT
jgi:ABC-type bacteriocin/lantibiotic exporter with double-glycine peptidase domain